MKKEKTKSPNKATQQEDSWVNIHDDNVMREMGIFRPYVQSSRDESVWTKTPNERRLLKVVKHTYKKGDMHFYTVPNKFIKVYGKLIIQLKKNKKYPKSTYSVKCWQSDIQNILSKYTVETNNKTVKNIVAKYSWNGRTYYPGELPS